MKIIFKHLVSPSIELEHITAETSLRDIKRFYEAKTSQKRSYYSFIINHIKGHINDNSLMKFSDYLKLIHQLDFDENATLEIHVVLNLGNNMTLFKHKTKIAEDIKDSDNNSKVICGISFEVIEGMPIKVNGRYYDSEFFCTYLIGQQNWYRKQLEYGKIFTPVCPYQEILPDSLQKIVTDPIPRTLIEMRRSDILGYLGTLFNDAIEDYEDDLSTVSALK